MTQTIDQRARELFLKHATEGALIEDIAHAALTEALTRMEELEGALKPFATVGKIIDGPFGPALFADDDMAFSSGCAWTENGEKKTLTWGDFRRATLTKGITE